jgi:hypothetical protein
MLTTFTWAHKLSIRVELLFALWVVSIIMPFIIYEVSKDKEYRLSVLAQYDREVLDVAKKYGGVLTLSMLVWELKIPLEEARKCLERFCKLGEAQKKKVGSITIYDFPSARIHLIKLDNQIIEFLRDNPQGLTRSTLLSLTNMSIDALDESLKRLESRGIIIHIIESDTYILRGITAPTAKY